MARRKKKSEEGGAAWLVTFSDLMTLLLTFFVLLLSMASMDTTVLTRISANVGSPSIIPISGPGRTPERIEIIVKMLKEPKNILDNRKRLKDLLFPRDILPKELSPGELDNNLTILEHPEGVVIVLTEGLLFPEGAATLDIVGRKLLDALTPVMHSVNADINISGHAEPGRQVDIDLYDLSYRRAATVLEHFLQQQIPPDRFSVSGYGADKPMLPNDTAEGRRKNRRVEILVKTTPRVGSYI